MIVPVSLDGSVLVLHFGDVATGARPLVLTPGGFGAVFGEEVLKTAVDKFRACPTRTVSLFLTGRIVEN